MENYEIELKKLKGRFDKDDLRIGKKLAEGCYNEHRGYEFSIETLRIVALEKNSSRATKNIEKLISINSSKDIKINHPSLNNGTMLC